jgi:single-strand DNA-binding protein
MNYQKVIVAGRATADAVQREAKSGEMKFTTFDVAVNDGKDQVTYFPVTVFGKTGEAAAKYVTKGRQVMFDGRIQVNDKKYFKVIADRVQFGPEPVAANKEKTE